jgi:hypothetical protein
LFRTRAVRNRRGLLALTDCHALSLPRALRITIGEHWTEHGEHDHAAIEMFEQLAQRLKHAGAPDGLVQRAHLAAEDKARHAALCFEQASRYLGVDVGPGRLRLPFAWPRRRRREIARLAVHTLREGMLEARYASEVTKAAMELAGDERVATALATFTVDESSHARLSADVISWCVQVGGDVVRGVLARTTLPRAARRELWSGEVTVSVGHGLLAMHGVAAVDADGQLFARAKADTERFVAGLIGASDAPASDRRTVVAPAAR